MLEVRGLTLSRGGKYLLEDASFVIGRGEKVGLVGVNGAGKTTLLKAISGEFEPDSGTISRPERLGYLGQERLADALLAGQGRADRAEPVTVREVMLAGRNLEGMAAELRAIEARLAEATASGAAAPGTGTVPAKGTLDALLARYGDLEAQFGLAGGYTAEHEIAELLEGLGLGDVELERPVEGLSGGQKTRLALARLMLGGYTTLLLDEPTNNLDPISRDRVREALVGYQEMLVMVSHDTEFVEALQPDLALLLPAGAVRYFDQSQLALVAKV